MSKSFTEKGGSWVVAQYALMVAVLAGGPFGRGDWLNPWTVVLGCALMTLGAWAGIAGALALGRNRTAFPVPGADSELIQHGVFSRIRHPLYTSLMLLGFGWGFWWESAAALMAAAGLSLQLRYKAAFEERQLERSFSGYADYRCRVPRFFPRFGKTFRPLPLAMLLGCALLPGSARGIDLAEAIAEAQRNNPDAVMARERIAMAEAAVTQADAMVWPTLAFRSGYQRTDNPIGVFGAALNQRSFSPALNFNDVPDADNLNVGGIVTVPIYTSGQITAGRLAARDNQQANAHLLDAVRNQLGFEVTRVYLTIRKTRAFVEAAEAAVGGFNENLDIARKRFESGKALKADVLDLEVRLAQAREELAQARNANELSRRALANLLGRETASEAELPQPVSDAPGLTVPVETTPNARPELLALSRMKSAAEAQVQVARSGQRPKVSAFASADHNRGWRFNGSGDSYTAGVLVNWNLWDGFLTRGKVREARSRMDILGEQHRQLRLAIDFEVQRAKLNLATAIERVGVAGKAVELAAESVKLTRARFEQGLALATQLIDSETALTGARVRLAQAESDRLIAIASLRKAFGLPQLETSTSH